MPFTWPTQLSSGLRVAVHMINIDGTGRGCGPGGGGGLFSTPCPLLSFHLSEGLWCVGGGEEEEAYPVLATAIPQDVLCARHWAAAGILGTVHPSGVCSTAIERVDWSCKVLCSSPGLATYWLWCNL